MSTTGTIADIGGATPFLAFGSAGRCGDVLAFAFLFVLRKDQARIEARLGVLKERYGIPPHVALHGALLIDPAARRQAGLDRLSDDDARAIVGQAVRLMNRGPVVLRYACDKLSRFADDPDNEIRLSIGPDHPALSFPARPDAQGLFAILREACFMVPADGSRGPPRSACQIVVADAAAAAPLLQLAEIAATLCSQAEEGADADFFGDQLRTLTYWTRIRLSDPAATA
jgi:hypothetical protein